MRNFEFWIGPSERESKNGLLKIFACSTAISLLSLYVKKVTKINQCESNLSLTDAEQKLIISSLECNNENLIVDNDNLRNIIHEAETEIVTLKEEIQMQRNAATKAEKRKEKLEKQIVEAYCEVVQTSVSLSENAQVIAEKDKIISQLRVSYIARKSSHRPISIQYFFSAYQIWVLIGRILFKMLAN